MLGIDNINIIISESWLKREIIWFCDLNLSDDFSIFFFPSFRYFLTLFFFLSLIHLRLSWEHNFQHSLYPPPPLWSLLLLFYLSSTSFVIKDISALLSDLSSASSLLLITSTPSFPPFHSNAKSLIPIPIPNHMLWGFALCVFKNLIYRYKYLIC